MPKQRLTRASQLRGLSIYQDPKRGTIFYDIFTRRAFILTASDLKTYMTYSSMFPVCILIGVGIMYLFKLDFLYSLLFAGIAYLVMMILFRVLFFYKLPEVENWKPIKKDNLIEYLAKEYSSKRLLVLAILLILLTILMPINANMEKMEGVTLYGSYLCALVTGIGTIIVIIAMITKKKKNYE